MFLKRNLIHPMLLIFSLAGCTSSNIQKVDCVAKYTTGSWPHEQRWVKITERRVDRVGNVWVHPKSDLILHFHGRWQRENLFTDYQCKDI